MNLGANLAFWDAVVSLLVKTPNNGEEQSVSNQDIETSLKKLRLSAFVGVFTNKVSQHPFGRLLCSLLVKTPNNGGEKMVAQVDC